MKQARRRGTAAAIDAMPRAQVSLFGPEHQPLAAHSQWYTRAPLAQRIAQWSGFGAGARLLEPAAGRGALIAPLSVARWTAVELDQDNFESLAALCDAGVIVERRCCDFLATTPSMLGDDFDAVIQNPPYEGDLDADFVMHALDFAPITIALLRSAFRHGEKRWERVWRWVDCTRQVEIINRPSFGSGLDGDNPMSDFAVFEFRRRPLPRAHGDGSYAETKISWWYV